MPERSAAIVWRRIAMIAAVCAIVLRAVGLALTGQRRSDRGSDTADERAEGRPPTFIGGVCPDQPKSALQISSMTSADAQASVVGTDQTSIWCLAYFTPSIRLMTQK